jgi:HEAT repeat protein
MDEESQNAWLVRSLARGAPEECIEAAKALARKQERSVLREVVDVLRHGDSAHARELAAWLLGELSPGTELTIEALLATLEDSDASEALRGQAAESLGNQVCHLSGGDVFERVADALLPLLEHPSVEILYNAAFALGAMRCRRARAPLARIAATDHRRYHGLDSVGRCAQFSIECIDDKPQGR